MADRKTPVEPTAPVEPTRRGRRKLEDVEAAAAKAAAVTASKANAAKTNARTKTAILTEQEKQAEILRRKREKEAKERKERNAQRWADFKFRAAAFSRTMMVVGPIVAPMSVAWTGQSGFAINVLGWNFLASILYAAAYELTTIFSAYMYHEAKKDGDKGWEYRIATWVFAAGAGLQQWWHYSDNWHATPRSVTYSTMTAIGVIVWELYARLIHRRGLRADGKLPGARPRIGLARWLRFFPISWIAWSGSVRHGFDNFQDMWIWAESEWERKRTRRDKIKDLKAENKDLKARLADLESLTSGQVIKGEIERVPTPDPKRTPVRTSRIEVGSVPTPTSAPELEAGSPAVDPDDESAEFRPTPAEIQAIKEMVEAEIVLNRQNVMDYIRDEDNRHRLGQPEGIATKRASELAKWGRNNSDGLKAVI